MALFDLPSVPVNGEVTVGLAAAAERAPDDADRVPLLEEPSASALCAYMWAKDRYAGRTHAEWYAAAAAVVGYWSLAGYEGRQAFDGHAVVGSRVAESKDVAAEIEEVKKVIGSDRRESVLLIGVATKVSFWQTNHHVGQSKLTAFVAKAIGLVFGQDLDEDVVKELKGFAWTIGHWLSTKAVLNDLGVAGIEEPPAIGIRINPTRDIRMRITSGPAGTGKAGICLAAFTRMAHGAFGDLVPVSDWLPRLLEIRALIREADAHLHVGSAYLTGEAQHEDLEPPEDYLANASAVAHALYRGTKLAESPSLVDVKSLTGNILFTQLMGIQGQVADAQMSNEQITEMVNAKVNLIAGNGARAFTDPDGWMAEFTASARGAASPADLR